MKTIFTFLTLPLIILVCFLSGKFYLNGEYILSYSLVFTWFASTILWINQVALQLQKQRA